MTMEKLMKPMLALAAAGLLTMTVTAQGMKKADTTKENTVMVGGEAMYPMKNIVENAVNSSSVMEP